MVLLRTHYDVLFLVVLLIIGNLRVEETAERNRVGATAVCICLFLSYPVQYLIVNTLAACPTSTHAMREQDH
jgi:hypothetical protein